MIRATLAALNVNLVIGSITFSPGRIFAFFITVWGTFLLSKFLRFLLEEDVYHRFNLARGIPYAISTMLHYVILLVGFIIALGAAAGIAFQLRAWTDQYREWAKVRSDLAVAVNDALVSNQVAIA